MEQRNGKRRDGIRRREYQKRDKSQPFSIMTSYNLLNGVHTANHYSLLQAMARDEGNELYI